MQQTGAPPSSQSLEQLALVFRKFLVNRRIRWTKAREYLLEAMMGFTGHFEADQLLAMLKQKGSGVGKATVYRTLPLLVECGILTQVRFDGKRAYYELTYGREPHDHMVCRRCGRIVEFRSDEIRNLRTKVAREHHFHAISHRFQISGLCWDCSIACPVAASPLPASPSGASLTKSKRRKAKTKRA